MLPAAQGVPRGIDVSLSYRTRGENAVGQSGVTFHVGDNGAADTVTLENLNTTGLGTFTR